MVFILQRSTTSSIIDLQNKLDWKQSFKTNWLLRLPAITKKRPPGFKTFSVPLRHGTLMIFKLVYAVSFCVQTKCIRQQSHMAILFAGIPVQGTKYRE